MKTGIIDCGGGLRDIYGAGVFDFCLDNNIPFDVVIGISAGSANIASFISGQRGRNYRFYYEYPFRKEYMSFENFINKKYYLENILLQQMQKQVRHNILMPMKWIKTIIGC